MTTETPMTPGEMAKEMKAIAKGKEEEETHWDADALMVKVLRSLGYTEAMKTYSSMHKWYS